MDVLGENEALQQFFEGHDVTGVLESPVVDTSMLEQYLSNDLDPSTFMLPESPPDSGSEPCSPPQIPDVRSCSSWSDQVMPLPAESPSTASCLFKDGIPGWQTGPPQHPDFMTLTNSCAKPSAPPLPIPCLLEPSPPCQGTAFPCVPPRPPYLSGSVFPEPKKRKHSDSVEGGVDSHPWNDPSRPKRPITVNAEPSGEAPSYDGDGQNGGSCPGAYQSLTWDVYQSNQWTALYSSSYKSLPAPGYHVDTDKGFNYSATDEAFVCQKKNHFQVTVHIGMAGNPTYVKTPQGVKPIENFYVKVFGIKVEAQNHVITIEQSQSDRSKKPFLPVKVSLPEDKITKVTLGRLHFSETTANNMRKKGKPNPDQRYFMLVVGLYASVEEEQYLLVAHVSEQIIVRASNPGQFENDSELLWQRGNTPDAVACHGRVGINTDSPDEALVVCGNMKVMGTVMHPSDRRAKQNIQEVDSTEQLKRIAQMRIVEYDYKPEFALQMGIDQTHETGIIAQEVKELLPSAVKEVGNVTCADGEKIPNFLWVDKEQIFMENVGAVKQLCKLTDNLENRIQELEVWNRQLAKLKRMGSLTSTLSAKSAHRKVSKNCSIPPSPKPSPIASAKKCLSEKYEHCSRNKFFQATIIALVLTMAFCVISITALYMLTLNDDYNASPGNSNDSLLSTPASTTTFPSSFSPPASTSSTTQPTMTPSPQPPDVDFCSLMYCEVVYCCPSGPSNHTASSPEPFSATTSPVSHTDTPHTVSSSGRENNNVYERILGHLKDDKDWKNTTIKSLFIKENQQIIDQQYCVKDHCGSGNYTYVIPISKYMHEDMRVTLQMNTTEALVIYLCKSSKGTDCMGLQEENSPENLLSNTQGYEHIWPLPVAHLHWSSYHFRVVVAGQANCNTDPNYVGVLFTDYHVYFYRRCT
ncbi:myelin regulatory factor-like protein isoform X1 [Lepisosteus oculatus]|uniref:myelin regulatory factor-like protein isoform X1 n=1 Tax=Lepisosteus oculatus TaxID=7918 RepID=UPI0037176D69